MQIIYYFEVTNSNIQISLIFIIYTDDNEYTSLIE